MSDQSLVEQDVNKALVKAAVEGDVKKVAELLKKGANIEFLEIANQYHWDYSGETPLLKAAAAGQFDVVRYLLTEANPKANVNAQDRHNNNLLHAAARSQNVKLFEWLINNFNLNVHAKAWMGLNLFHIAIEFGGSPEIVKYILNNKLVSPDELTGYTGETALHLAARRGDIEIITAVLQASPESVQARSKNQATPLHRAARQNNLAVFKLIYTAFKEAIKIQDNEDFTPVHWAVLYGSVEVLEFLLTEYPEVMDIRVKPYGKTLTHLAAEEPANLDTVKFLVKKFPQSLLERTTEKEYPLFLAIKSNHKDQRLEVVKFILNTHPELYEQRDDHGRTPLHIAVMHASNIQDKDFRIIEYILDNFPESITKFDDRGRNAVELAATNIADENPVRSKTAREIVRLFFSRGAYFEALGDDRSIIKEKLEKLLNLNSKSKLNDEEIKLIQELGTIVNVRYEKFQGNTPLHLAISKGNKDLAFRLLEAGARLDLKNKLGQTPLDLIKAQEDKYFEDLANYFRTKELIVKLENTYKEQAKVAAVAAVAKAIPPKEKKESMEKEEKVKIEDSTSILTEIFRIAPQVFKMSEHLHGFPKDIQEKVYIDLANILAPVDSHGELLATPYPVLAYQILQKIDKDNKFFKEANKRMHALLVGGLVLVPQGPDQEPLPRTREEVLKMLESSVEQSKEVKKAAEAVSLDEDEAAGEQVAREQPVLSGEDPQARMDNIDKFTLKYKIKHLSIADPHNKLLNNYMSQYTSASLAVMDSRDAERIRLENLETGVQDNPKEVMRVLDLNRDKQNLSSSVVTLNLRVQKLEDRVLKFEDNERDYKKELKRVYEENEALKRRVAELEQAQPQAQVEKQPSLTPQYRSASPPKSPRGPQKPEEPKRPDLP